MGKCYDNCQSGHVNGSPISAVNGFSGQGDWAGVSLRETGSRAAAPLSGQKPVGGVGTDPEPGGDIISPPQPGSSWGSPSQS